MIAGTLEIQLLANLARLQKDMDDAKRAVGGAMKSIESAVNIAKGAFIGLASVTAAISFLNTIKGAIDAADNLNDLSKSTAISVENLSGLSLAAKQSGSELDSIAQSINKLSVNIGKDSERFAKLGITAKEPIEAFKQLSDIYKSIEDPQVRAAVAAEALGKSWQGAAPLLAEGSESIGDMVEKGRRLSGVTQEMADEADKFNDSLEELKQKSDGLVIKFAGEVLPAFNQLLPAIKSAYEESGKLQAAWVAIGSLGAFLFTDEFSSDKVKLQNLKDELNDLYADQKARAATFGFDGSLKRLLFGGYSTDELPKAIEYTKYQIQQLEAQIAQNLKPQEKDLIPKRPNVDTKSFLSSASKEKDDYDKLNKTIQARISAAQEELRLGRSLSDAEKESANLKRGLEEGTIKLTAAEVRRYEGSIKQLDIELKKIEAEKLYQAAHDKNELDIRSINDETSALQAQIDAYQKVPSLITEANIAKLESKKADLNASGLDNINDEIDAINRKIDAYKKLKDTQIDKQFQDASKAIGDYKKSIEVSNVEIELGASLIGKSTIERDVLLGQAKVQIELENKINEIKKQGLTAEKEATLIEQVKQAARLEDANVLLRSQDELIKENQKFNDQLYQGFTDSIFRAVEKGGSFIKNWWTSTKNLIETSAIKLTIQATIGSVLGGSGLANAASGAGSAGGVAGAIGGIGNIAGSIGNLFSGASTLGANFVTSGIGQSLGLSTALDGGFAFSGLGSAIASIGSALPYVGAALAAYKIGKSAFGHQPREITGTTISGTLGTDDISRVDEYVRKGGLFSKTKRGTFDYNLATSAAVADGKTYVDTGRQAENTALLKSLNDAYSALKTSSADYAKALGIDATSIADRTDKISYAIGKTADETQANFTKAIGAVGDDIANSVLGSFAQLKKEGETSSQTLTRLATDLTAVNATLGHLGLSLYTIDVNGSKAAESLVAAFGSVDNFVNASKSYYDNFYSESEKTAIKTQELTKAFSDAGLVLPQTREGFRAAVEVAKAMGDNATLAKLLNLSSAFADVVAPIEDVTASLKKMQDEAKAAYDASVSQAKSDLLDAYNAESQSLQSVIDRLKNFKSGLDTFLDQSKLNDASLSPEARFLEAQRQYKATLSKAAGGDSTAQGQLTSIAQAYLDANKIYNASTVAANDIFSSVQNDLAALSKTADRQISSAQLQLDQLKTQVSQLITIDKSVLSVKDAIANLTKLLARTTVGGSGGVGVGASVGDVPVPNGGGFSGAAGQAIAGEYQKVSDYGAQYGRNAYYFFKGISDLQGKLDNAQSLYNFYQNSKETSDIVLQEKKLTPDDLLLQTTGHTRAYWEAVQKAYDAGLHPTTDFVFNESATTPLAIAPASVVAPVSQPTPLAADNKETMTELKAQTTQLTNLVIVQQYANKQMIEKIDDMAEQLNGIKKKATLSAAEA